MKLLHCFQLFMLLLCQWFALSNINLYIDKTKKSPAFKNLPVLSRILGMFLSCVLDFTAVRIRSMMFIGDTNCFTHPLKISLFFC